MNIASRRCSSSFMGVLSASLLIIVPINHEGAHAHESGQIAANPNRGVSFVEVASQAGVAGPALPHGHGATFGDFNGDGLQDLCVVIKNLRNFLYINQGDERFIEIADSAGLNLRGPQRNRGVTSADYDNDGDADLFFCSGDDDALLRNNGDLSFTDVTDDANAHEYGNGVVGTWSDYDNDGYQGMGFRSPGRWCLAPIGFSAAVHYRSRRPLRSAQSQRSHHGWHIAFQRWH